MEKASKTKRIPKHLLSTIINTPLVEPEDYSDEDYSFSDEEDESTNCSASGEEESNAVYVPNPETINQWKSLLGQLQLQVAWQGKGKQEFIKEKKEKLSGEK